MSRFLVYALIFSAGVACGVALTVYKYPDNGPGLSPGPSADVAELSAHEQPPEDEALSIANGRQEDRQEVISGALSTEVRTASATADLVHPEIPESYRATIGPVVQHVSFGEKYQDFEEEPIDEPWAIAMETGINDFIAIHGPASGEVFEFVQCRSSHCVLAGYTLAGQEPRGASVIGQLSDQPWWQGAREASSTYSSGNDRTSFVILIPRFED